MSANTTNTAMFEYQYGVVRMRQHSFQLMGIFRTISQVSRCFAAFRQMRAVRHYVTVPIVQSLVTSMVSTRMDYCNNVIFELLAIQLCRLQSVQNSAARLIFNLRRSAHISDALICLLSWRVAERIRFKMAVMTYRSLHVQTPFYLADFIPLSALSGRSSRRTVSKFLERDFYHRRSCIPGRRRLCMERPAIRRHLFSQPQHFPFPPQNIFI
jgi:hypothetical protein